MTQAATLAQLASSGALSADTSGNVGIGTTTPATKLHVSQANTTIGALFNGTTRAIRFGFDTTGSVIEGVDNTGVASFQPLSVGGADVRFLTSNTERMRINSDGRIGIGYTGSPGDYANSQVAIINSTNMPLFVGNTSSGTGPAAILSKGLNSTATSNIFMQFLINGISGTSGQINANGANSAAFGTYSDARLKENIVDLPSQIANVMALRPVEYDYIESEGGGHQIGFIAQEVNEIYPDLVGEREDGMFTLTDMNKNDARLIKAIQEQQAMILELKAELDAIKAKVGV